VLGMFYRKQKCRGVSAPLGLSISDAVHEDILIEFYFCDFRSKKSTALFFSTSLNQGYRLVRYKWALFFVNTYSLKHIIKRSCKIKDLSYWTEIACCETLCIYKPQMIYSSQFFCHKQAVHIRVLVDSFGFFGVKS